VATATRGVLEEARPGYFGVGLPVGKLFATRPQGRFALIKKSSLQNGWLYPGVVHDGLIAFWNPSVNATKVRLRMADIKTDFGADNMPKASLDFEFDFTATKP